MKYIFFYLVFFFQINMLFAQKKVPISLQVKINRNIGIITIGTNAFQVYYMDFVYSNTSSQSVTFSTKGKRIFINFIEQENYFLTPGRVVDYHSFLFQETIKPKRSKVFNGYLCYPIDSSNGKAFFPQHKITFKFLLNVHEYKKDGNKVSFIKSNDTLISYLPLN